MLIDPKWTDELRIYGEGFVGRQDELAALDRAWAHGAQIFALHAEGGAGKTRVVVEWLRQMRDAGWRRAQRVFVHSFYSQGSDERRNATSELFFEQALAYFGYQGEPILQADEKGRTLAGLLIEHHGLLVLDGLEPLQHPTQHAEKGRLKDPSIARLVLSLSSVPGCTPGLCLITSRQPVVEIEGRLGATVLQQSLDHLHRDDGAMLLKQFQVAGPDEELKKASDEFRGHAYSLMLLGSYLKTATDHHDIRRREEVLLLEEDSEHGNHARSMFAAYVEHLGEDSPEVAVLRLLGFFDRAAERELLGVLRAREGVVYEWSKEVEETDRQSQSKRIGDALSEVTAPLLDLPQAQWHRVLHRLRDLRLIDLTGPEKSPSVDAHPLLRECFAEQVRTQFPAAWQAGHRRLFEHLSGTAPYWPEGIEGLQPLYQAVAHGCLAGLHEQARAAVYRNRILRGTGDGGFYSERNLGAIGADLGAVACFFKTPWTTFAPNLAPADQAWLLNDAAFHLRALGRLSEAIEPVRAGLDMRVQQEEWLQAAHSATNMSELELTRGEVAAAMTAGEQAVTYADRSEDAFRQVFTRTALADALHQAGQRGEPRRLFEDAESRQAADAPEYPRLVSLRGFQYCDFLLSEPERAAWQQWLGAEAGPSEAAGDAVSERASQTLAWSERRLGLLTIALDHLTLARAALYKRHPDRDHIEAAVDGLRAAGNMSYLPRGLLTRAWQRCLSRDEVGARADLDEAWEIAERGPMPLFQADIQLTRARLFRDRSALAEARRLIERHGYHRRDGELADAEAAADSPHPWPLPRGAGEGNRPPTVPTNQVVHETPSEDSMRDQVFISYSHEDEKLMKELLKHLKPFSRSGTITVWSDEQIAKGSQWFKEIQTALEKASVAVLLVSPDFFASDFIHEHELGPLLKEAEAGGVRILWVPLRSSSFEETPLGKYQAVSSPNKPLSQMSKADRDEVWVRICKEIKKAAAPVASTVGSSPKPPSGAVPSAASSTVGGPAFRKWQEKLDYLLEQDAIASDPNQRFQLRNLIEEARQKIRELGGQA